MTRFVINPPSRPAVPVLENESLFPVRRIYCLGLNYADHVTEMGKSLGLAARPDMLFFSKPADSVLPPGQDFPYPPATDDCHFEVEMVVALHKGGRDIPAMDALNCVFGYAVGIDMTRRDLQSAVKVAGHPWDMAKGFDYSAPISTIVPAAAIGHPRSGTIWLKQNGIMRQQSDLKNMLVAVPDMIAQLSKLVELKPGDLIFTGTPAGVGPCRRGDVLEAGIDGIAELKLRIA